MLVLSRKLGEELVIGDTVVQVVRCGNHAVRLGIKAPDNIRVLRRELLNSALDITTSHPIGGNESRTAEGPLAAELEAAKAAPRRAG